MYSSLIYEFQTVLVEEMLIVQAHSHFQYTVPLLLIDFKDNVLVLIPSSCDALPPLFSSQDVYKHFK